MLCYQSSRDAEGMLHDTFRWLTQNKRAFFIVMLPVTIVAMTIFAAFGTGFINEEILYRKGILQILYRALSVKYLGLGFFYPNTLGWILALLSFVTTFFYTPLLIKYFIERQSIRSLTIISWTKMLGRCWIKSLITASVTGLYFFAWAFLDYAAMTLPTIFFVWIQPSLYTYKFNSLNSVKFLSFIKSILYIVLIFSVIKGFPTISTELVTLVIEMLDESLHILDYNSVGLMLMINTMITGVTYIAFCVAIVVMQTSNLLLYGSIYANKRS